METTFFTRRRFIAGASCFGAAAALARAIPLPALAETFMQDKRVAEAPLLDKGFASVRRVGQGVYATISDSSKGIQTLCNGGFLVGTEGALLLFRIGMGTLESISSISQHPLRVPRRLISEASTVIRTEMRVRSGRRTVLKLPSYPDDPAAGKSMSWIRINRPRFW